MSQDEILPQAISVIGKPLICFDILHMYTSIDYLYVSLPVLDGQARYY